MKRLVLVTGGGRGIGRAVAARFRADGDDVVVTGRDHERLAATAAEIGARPVVCDAADPEQVSRLASDLGAGLDVLVNMAGGNRDLERRPGAGLAAIRSAWLANLEANLLSAVLTTAAVDGRLRPGGCVINVGSIGAEYAGSSYGAAKAALAAWTAGLSATLGPRGVTANVIAPGYVAGTGFFRGQLSDERRATLIESTHTGRAGEPADIAETAFFLASAGARHITGQTVHVNGGAHTTR
jgi:3-oxoacyl-[acyl-carrier protein] reductase